ncbi:MAG: hypothetical protein WA688_00735 [Thermoplasmata archaeon]
MVECPVCGVESSQEQVACAVCGLPTKFFNELHVYPEVATVPESVPRVDGSPVLVETAPSGPLTPTPVGPPPTPPDSARQADTSIPRAGGIEPESGRAIEEAPPPNDEALRIGRSLGIDVTGFEEILRHPSSYGSPAQLSRVRHGMVSAVLDGLIHRYRGLCERRDVLSSVMRTRSLDAELAAYRRALSKGELARADAQRRTAQLTVESLEASLGRIRIRLNEASQLMRALRELGGVAPKVLRPVAEAVKGPHRVEAGQIERRLDQTNVLLWGLLVPRMNHEISRCLSLLDQSHAPASRTAPIRCEIDRMAEKIRAQEITGALASHRFLTAELASLAPLPQRNAVARFTIDQTHRS